MSPSNLELLMSPAADAPSTSTRPPLFDDPEDQKMNAAMEIQSQRMEAIQAALTDIIALDNQTDDRQAPSLSDSLTGSTATLAAVSTTEDTRRDPPSDEDPEDPTESTHGSFQPAGPGDLQLSYEIDRLGAKISRLESQDGVLDSLIKKAELTGDDQQLRLFIKSKSSLTRELRELRFQKTQYEQQESANRLVSDRTMIGIVNAAVAEEEGKSVVRYLVEVKQLAPDGSFASGWLVARRYNEFHNMHNKLREKYVLVRGLDFPGKRLVTSLSGSFVDSRKMALEKYLQVSCTQDLFL